MYISFAAFSDELQKIAQDAAPTPSSEVAAKAIGGGAAVLGGQAALGHGRNVLMEMSKKAPSAEEAKLVQKMISKADVPVREMPMHGGAYNPITKEVLHGPGGWKRPSIIGHELGHRALDKRFLGKLIQNPLTTAAGAITRARPVAALTGIVAGSSEDERVRKYLPALPALAGLPTLGYEALASLGAIRQMKGMKASPAAIRAAYRQLLPAWGTYAGATGRATGISYGASALANLARNARVREAQQQAASEAA